MADEDGLEPQFAVLSHAGQRATFVPPGQAGTADDIGGQNGSKSAQFPPRRMSPFTSTGLRATRPAHFSTIFQNESFLTTLPSRNV